MPIASSPFPCSACGQCCRCVHLSEQTAFLNRGDGVCRYFNESTNLCRIYHERPLVCRVEDYYKIYLAEKIKWVDFVEMNLEVCRQLQNDGK